MSATAAVQLSCDGIPEELKKLNQWTCWRYGKREDASGKIKITKIPCDFNGDEHDVAENPPSISFTDALTAYVTNRCGALAGIGFIFFKDGPYAGIDLDDCIVDEKLLPEAQQIVEMFPTYGEISPSGNGVKLFMHGKLPGARRRTSKPKKIEMYDDKRFFTVTGNKLPDHPCEINDCQDALADLYFKTFGKEPAATAEPATTTLPTERLKPYRALKDEQLLEAVRRHEPSFNDLWQDVREINASDGDYALARILLRYTGRDLERTEQLMRQSKRYRAKFNEQHGALSYLRLTVENANKKTPDAELWSPPGLLGASSVAQILAATPEEREWLAWLLASRGLATILDGLPKLSGKTILLLSSILASSTEKTFLGKATTSTPIVYVSEQSRSSLAEQLRKLGFPNIPPERLMFVTRENWANMLWNDFVDALYNQWLVPMKAGWLILDTFYAMARVEDEGDASQVTSAAKPILDMTAELNLATILSRHDRKAGGDIGVSGRGSIQLTGMVDIIAHLSRPGGKANPTQRLLKLLGRVEMPEQEMIQLTPLGYLALGSRVDVKTAELEKTILERAPTSSAEALPIMKILDDRENCDQPVRSAVQRLVKNGDLKQRTVKQGRKNQIVYWCEMLAIGFDEEQK